MIFYCLGIDHKETKLEVREAAARKRDSITRFWQGLNQASAVLFTCNRIELYGIARDLSSMSSAVSALRREFPILFKDAYLKQGKERVIKHALELASGLHSQIIGEGQIYQQLNSWVRQNLVSQEIKNLWIKVLPLAKNIRAKLGISEKDTSIADIVLSDLAYRLRSPRPKEVVVVGTGKIGELIADRKIPGINFHFVSRKRVSKARQLAKASGGRAILFDNLFDVLISADGLISATASPHYILGREELLRAVNKRDKLLYVYDLAVPRDIEPKINGIQGVLLQNLDDLNVLFKEHNKNLKYYVQQAEGLIEESIRIIEKELYESSYQSRNQAEPISFKAV